MVTREESSKQMIWLCLRTCACGYQKVLNTRKKCLTEQHKNVEKIFKISVWMRHRWGVTFCSCLLPLKLDFPDQLVLYPSDCRKMYIFGRSYNCYVQILGAFKKLQNHFRHLPNLYLCASRTAIRILMVTEDGATRFVDTTKFWLKPYNKNGHFTR
jgi:hypothetical protein